MIVTLVGQSLATVGSRSEIMAEDRPANMNRYIGRQSLATVAPRSEMLAGDRPAINILAGNLGHGWTKIRNTGKSPAGQHKSKHWPTNRGPRLDKDQKYCPKRAGMDWKWTNIGKYYVLIGL